jgi:murein DD-endopeptidase MepM/ murein hydrolase activator NlpD
MPAGDFFGRGVAPVADPFTAYLNPKTMTQQRATAPNWTNVGHGGSGSPFGQNQGDISQAGWQNPIDLFTRQAEKEMAKLAGQVPSGGPAGPMGSPNTPEWQQVNRWDSAVQAAASRYGVDPNRLKAHMMIESGGDPGAVQPNTTNGYTYGLMQINTGIWGATLAAQGIDPSTPEGNIMGAAYILADGYKRYGNWDQSSSAYFLGNPNWQGADTYNGNTGSWYQSELNKHITTLGSGGGAGGSAGIASIFGGGQTPISYEFDAPSVNGNMYNYASSSGLSGMSHPGIDVSVPYGTALFSPGSGVVSCVGNADAGVGGTGGGSCGYFGDTDGGGVGNITIKLDNGTFIILGHSSAASVRPGQRVTAGMQVGASGGMYGAHTHLEVRVPDASMPSGYRIVDPRSVLGQGAMGPGYQQGAQSQSQAYGSGSLFGNWDSLMDPNAPWRSYRR